MVLPAAGKGRRRSAATVVVVGLFVLVVVAAAAVIITLDARSSEAQSRRRMQAVATLTQAFVAEQTAGLKSLVSAYADRLTAAGALEPTNLDAGDNVVSVLSRLRESRPDITVTALTDADGVLLGTRPDSPALVGKNFAYRDWYRGAARTGLPYMSEVYQSAAVGQPFVVAASVVVRGRASNGRPGPVLGVLTATYSLSSFQRFVDRYADDTGIRLAIVDQRGVLVAAAGDHPVVTGGLEARRDAGRRALDSSGVVSAFVTDAGSGWRVGSAIPLDAARSSAAGFRWVVLTGGGLIVVLVVGAAFVEARLRRGRRRSDEDIAQFFGVSLDLLCIAGTDGYFKRINPAWKSVLGYDEEDLLGKPFLSFVHPDDVDATLAEMATLATGATTLGFENRYRCRDGTYRWLLWQTAPLPERRLMYAVARDITERKANEQTLAQVAAIVDSSVDAIIGADLDGVITSWNHGAEQIFGYPSEQIIGKSIRLLSPADHEEQDDKLTRAARGESIPPYEAVRIRQDGRPIDVALTKSPVRNADGSVVGIAMIARDITDAKRVADALGAIIESATDAFISIDSEDNVTEWNHRAETLFGWQRDEVLGRDLTDLVIPDRAKEAHRAGVEHAFTGGGSGILNRSREIVAVGRNGVEFPAEITVWPVKTSSGDQFSAFVRDVSQRQLFERQLADARDAALEASRQKSEFLATMSHEIRTPMNGVIGLTGLLLRGELNDTARHYAERIRVAGKALLAVINDILDFSKIEAGALILDDAPVNLSLVVEDVLELVAESARAKGLELIGHCGTDLPELVRGDPVRIRQILLNFAVNAVKFTEHGEVFVHVRRAPEATGQSTTGEIVNVRLEVTDTGIGIPAEQHARLFTAFAQADSSTTRRFGGTGLGLAICQRLVETMGGQIGVDSQVGSGSVFWCHLPLRHEPASASLPARTSISLKGVRLLVVDDNATTRSVLTKQAHAWGMQVTAVTSGDEAVNALLDACSHQAPFDILVTDLHMPEPDGLQLAATISGHPQIQPLPIVLMTVDAPPAPAEIAGLGITATITKPIQQSQLYDCLMQIVAGLQDPTTASATARGPATPANGQRLLLAEDNETNQIVAMGVLHELGYQVDVAADGMQALDLLSRNTYSAVIMDCQMPNMDGYEAASEIRRREANTTPPDHPSDGTEPRRVPIIAMTAAALKDDRDRCYAAGMDDYLSKPFEPEDLAMTIHRWVEDAVPADRIQPVVTPGALEITNRLNQLREHLPPASIDRLTASFLRDSVQCIADLRAASARSDADTLARTAHTLKGAASSIGAGALAALCQTLEERATGGDLHDAADRIAQLEAQYEHVRDLLQTLTPSAATH